MMPPRCFEDEKSYILYLGLAKYPLPIVPMSIQEISNRRIHTAVAREILEEFNRKGYVEKIIEGRRGSKRYYISPAIPPDEITMNVANTHRYLKYLFDSSEFIKLYDWKFIYMVQSAVVSRILRSVYEIDISEHIRRSLRLSLREITEIVGEKPMLFGYAINVNDVLEEIERIVNMQDNPYMRTQFTGDWKKKAFDLIKILSGATVVKLDGPNVSLLFILEPAYTTELYFRNY